MKPFPVSVQKVIGAVTLIAAVILACAIMSGCIAPKNLAKVCAIRFPESQYDSTRVEYREGQTVWRLDTVETYVDCDSVVRTAINGGKSLNSGNSANKSVSTTLVRIPCPPCPVRVDTVIHEHERQVENTAKVQALQQDKERATADAVRLKTQRNICGWAAGIGWLLVIGSIVFKLIKAKAKLL